MIKKGFGKTSDGARGGYLPYSPHFVRRIGAQSGWGAVSLRVTAKFLESTAFQECLWTQIESFNFLLLQ